MYHPGGLELQASTAWLFSSVEWETPALFQRVVRINDFTNVSPTDLAECPVHGERSRNRFY